MRILTASKNLDVRSLQQHAGQQLQRRKGTSEWPTQTPECRLKT